MKLMKDREKVILAVDLGGSKYMTGLITKSGDIIYKNRRVWGAKSSNGIVEEICKAIEEVIHLSEYEIEAIGVTVPGTADPKTGVWVNSNYLGIRNLPLGEIISNRFCYPVFIDNDCKACVLAERYFGAGDDCDDFLYMTVSTGVGGALFLNGELYYGAYNNAGEIGHCVVVEDGRSSKHGSPGTLEAYAAADGIVQNYLELGGNEMIDGELPNGKSITKLAAEGDLVALRTFELEGYYLGKVIASVYTILDIKKVIIGGGLSLAFEFFRKSLESTIEKNSFKRGYPTLSIESTPLGYDGALIGAATLALRGLAKN
ncbi:ROK family protein [Bacillus sp. IITD106]|nr:ROK family protein [Bacillus sp. IITD106]